ncbi:MAG: nickel pincer cofactor biosynthesis protein LarC, partial [Acidobacteriota bacterium]
AKTLHFDCFSGASGDMVLGALLDLGLPIEGLRAALGSLAIEYGGITADRVLRAGVSATKFRALADEARQPAAALADSHGHDAAHEHAHDHPHSHEHEHGAEHAHSHSHSHSHSHDAGHEHAHTHPHTHDHPHPHGHDHQAHHSLKEIGGFIGRSALSAAGKRRAIELFERLAEAEAAIHAMPVEQVHLHEVGALDSIIDIVGAVYGLEWLAADVVTASPLNVGSGVVLCAHGTFPVPAPATARLLKGAPVYAGAVEAELVTPTGALIVTGYASAFGPLPQMRLDAIGYGAGSRDFPGHPNVLRLLVGDAAGHGGAERIVSIECEIDDMNPQLFGPLMDRLAEAGALDVFYAAVQMKKNRPGTLVTVLARPEDREAIAGVMFAHTTTIGVRYQEMLRDRLDREITSVETPLGPIRFKIARRDGRVLNAAPEFEDCARVGMAAQVPIKDVQAMAMKAWLER